MLNKMLFDDDDGYDLKLHALKANYKSMVTHLTSHDATTFFIQHEYLESALSDCLHDGNVVRLSLHS